VTPHTVRLRKVVLEASQRARLSRRSAASAS
jgi:predicted membrane GTPase involved in stress response